MALPGFNHAFLVLHLPHLACGTTLAVPPRHRPHHDCRPAYTLAVTLVHDPALRDSNACSDPSPSTPYNCQRLAFHHTTPAYMAWRLRMAHLPPLTHFCTPALPKPTARITPIPPFTARARGRLVWCGRLFLPYCHTVSRHFHATNLTLSRQVPAVDGIFAARLLQHHTICAHAHTAPPHLLHPTMPPLPRFLPHTPSGVLPGFRWSHFTAASTRRAFRLLPATHPPHPPFPTLAIAPSARTRLPPRWDMDKRGTWLDRCVQRGLWIWTGNT